MPQKSKTIVVTRTMAHTVEGQLVLVVHGEPPPTDDEWLGYLDTLKMLLEKGPIEQLIMTTGGGPNVTQRKMLNEAIRGRPNRVAVSTGSTMVRGMVTAISWFNPQIAAFAPDQLAHAFDYLSVPREKVPMLMASVRELHNRLGSNNSSQFGQLA